MSVATDHSDLHSTITGHPCWRADARPGSPGYTLPLDQPLTCYATGDEADVAALAAIGITAVCSEEAESNYVHVASGHGSFDVRLEFLGGGNTAFFGCFRHLAGKFVFLDKYSVLILGGARHEVAGIYADLIGPSTGIFTGVDTIAYGCRITVEAAGSVCIGDGCLISDQIEIRGTDSHAIIDCETRQVVNPPQPVVIEPRVWVGQKVSVLKGSAIGAGSVIAAHAVVTGGLIPQNSVAGGLPAKVLRRASTWYRHYPSGILEPVPNAALAFPPGFRSIAPDSRRYRPPPRAITRHCAFRYGSACVGLHRVGRASTMNYAADGLFTGSSSRARLYPLTPNPRARSPRSVRRS